MKVAFKATLPGMCLVREMTNHEAHAFFAKGPQLTAVAFAGHLVIVEVTPFHVTAEEARGIELCAGSNRWLEYAIDEAKIFERKSSG